MVLFFPDQRLDPQGLAKVGRQFGELIYYPFVEGLPEEPFVIPLIKEAFETKIFGEGWHSDTTYTEQPPKATALYSIEVPDTGGDTMFANMYQAYETLSPGMKELLAPLQAVNSASARKGGGRAAGKCLSKREVDKPRSEVRRHSSGCSHASRNGPGGALRQCAAYYPFRWLARSGEQTALGFSAPS